MGNKQGLEAIAEIAHDPRAGRIEFVFCGEGPGRAGLVEATAGLPNVRFLPLQPFERLNALLNLADIHLLPQRAGMASLVMPSKLTGMLASGRPVLAWADEGTALAEQVKGCGAAVPPDQTAKLADALFALAGDAAERKRLGAAAREKAVRELGQDSVHAAYESVLARVAGAA
jgi:colanic acid biosynthesis glycosyl transferase WcaI